MARLNCVTVLAPAKLNLALDVVGLLPNGYHDLDMTMQAITLYERVVLRRSPYLNLRLPGSLVAPNNKNTAIKAALAFFDYTGLLAGVDITIYKNTPVRAGMAGGSADAAAVLVGMNELYGARLSMSELCALGAKIGADVPFALMGGTCRVQGVGDVMKALPPCPDCWFTVVMPDYGVSTPEAFAAYDRVGSSRHPDCEAQEQAIRVLPVLLFVNAMRNQLSIPPTFINAEQLINLFGLRDTARQFGRPQSVFDSSFNPLTFSTTVKYLAFFAGQEWLRHMRFLEWDPKQAEQDAKDEDERKSREALAKKYNLTSDGDNAASDADLDSSADSNLSEDSDSSEEAGSEPTEE